MAKSYKDPDSASFELGIETPEVPLQESTFDDVDDYHGFVESPPNAANGVVLAGYVGWTRGVNVSWVNPLNLSIVSSESGVKRITVTVMSSSGQTSTAVGIVANAP